MRVVGDAMDLALLRRAAASHDARRDRISAATASVLGIGATDLLTAVGSLTGEGGALAAKPVTRSITIGRSPAEVYAFWRRLEQLPMFMRHLESVQELDDRRSHWVATGPMGARVEWDAQITADEADRSISWRALPGSVRHEGTVRFEPAPGDRGTEVHVNMTYQPPAGALGVAIAKLSGREPEQQVAEDLRRLKQILETGQVVRSEATIGGRRLRQRPAEPLAEPPPEAPPTPIEPAARWSGPRPTRTSADGMDDGGAQVATSEASDGKQQPVDATAPTTGGTR
jgi:uncharacterized membrane protein